jgi:hypothetical protein
MVCMLFASTLNRPGTWALGSLAGAGFVAVFLCFRSFDKFAESYQPVEIVPIEWGDGAASASVWAGIGTIRRAPASITWDEKQMLIEPAGVFSRHGAGVPRILMRRSDIEGLQVGSSLTAVGPSDRLDGLWISNVHDALGPLERAGWLLPRSPLAG